MPRQTYYNGVIMGRYTNVGDSEKRRRRGLLLLLIPLLLYAASGTGRATVTGQPGEIVITKIE